VYLLKKKQKGCFQNDLQQNDLEEKKNDRIIEEREDFFSHKGTKDIGRHSRNQTSFSHGWTPIITD